MAEQWVSSRLTPSWDKVYASLDVKGTGAVTKQQRDEWFEQAFTGQVESNEDSRKEAILGEVQRQGRFGLNKDGSPINLTQEQINEVFSSPEQSAKYLLDYKNRSKAIFDQDAALEYVTPYASRKDVRDYNLQIAKLYGDRDKEFTGSPRIYVTGSNQGMVALPAPIKIGGKQIYQYGIDLAGNKYLFTSQKNELGQEVPSIVKATDEEFKSAEALIDKEFKDSGFFARNLLEASQSIPKVEGEISDMAKETPMASSRELEVQFKEDKVLIGEMTGGIRRGRTQALNQTLRLANKYPDAFKRSGMDLKNLTVEDVDRFAEEIAADQSGSVTKAKGAEKAITVSKKSAQETKEYDKLSALTFEVGSALGVRQLPEETSDKYFERIKGKASEIMSDTYRSQGIYKSKSGNEENARLRRILEFRTPYQEASRAYNDFIDAVEELESARK
jgi:hypothetical protein